MKKKSATLLNETAIRKFMKLANLGKLTENFMDQLEEKDEELPPEEDDGGPPQVGEPEEAPIEDPMPGDGPPIGEPEGDEGLGAESPKRSWHGLLMLLQTQLRQRLVLPWTFLQRKAKSLVVS